jgi:hypothetical protein
VTDGNECERAALTQLAQAPIKQPVVQLGAPCSVLSWQLLTDPAASATNAEMLVQWGVTRGRKLYYH